MINFNTIYDGIPKFTFANSNVASVINKALFYIFAIAGFMLLIYLIYGGFQLMTSGGDPEKIKGAKEILTRTIMGFLVIFIAYWIIQIVGIAFGLTDVQNTFKPIGP